MNPLSRLYRYLEHKRACKRLDTLVAQTRARNAEYPKRRAAGKLGYARRAGE